MYLNLCIQFAFGTLPSRLRELSLPRFILTIERRSSFCIYEFPAVLADVVLSGASSFIKRQIIEHKQEPFLLKTDNINNSHIRFFLTDHAQKTTYRPVVLYIY